MEFTDRPEEKGLVVWSLDKELQLRMLVGYAESRSRGLPAVHLVVPPVEFLTEAFSPQLLEPERKLPKRLGVGKQHENGFPELMVENPLDKGGGKGRIFEERPLGLNRGLGSSAHHGDNVQYRKRGRQRADRREHAKSAAHISRDFEHGKPLLPSDCQEISLFRICRHRKAV